MLRRELKKMLVHKVLRGRVLFFPYGIMKINFAGDVKPYMSKIISSLVLFFLLLLPAGVWGADIAGIEAHVVNGEVLVNTALSLDDKNLTDLKNGISKEITFYVDLFRLWKSWPDEFIAGKKIVKTLRSDPIKKEYVATSLDGTLLIEKRFKSFDSMVSWALSIKNIRLADVRELQQADYFVRVTVESRLRKLPPVIGYLLFFVPENDFRLQKDSPLIPAGSAK
jgi:hypothetical protein